MIELRNYQLETVRQTHEAIRSGARRVLVCAPTGSGKRFVACWWAARIAEKGKRLLAITDRRILVYQMCDELQRAGIQFGTIMGNEPRNDGALVQIASLQTLVARGWRDVPKADWVIHDECHKALIAAKRLQTMRPGCVWIGLSATPCGPQGRTLIGSHYDQLIESVRNTELIAAGWLLSTKVWHPFAPDTRGIGVNADGEFNQTQLGGRVKECISYANIFEWWGKYSHLQTICFVPGVCYARWLSSEFTKRGHAAAVVEAGTKSADRRDYFAAFARGEIRVLCSCDVLREGFDSPIAQCGIDLQPNRQLRTYWQKVGRVKRPHEGQEHAVWLDFAGNFWRFPHPDEDPIWPTGTNTTTQDLIKHQRDTGERKPWSCPSCAYSLSPWERIHDGKCPSCGAPIRKAVKRIRMADGSMKSTSAKEKKKTQQNRDIEIWFSCFYPVLYSGRPLNLARIAYHKRTGKWPEPPLPYVLDDPRSGDWNRPAIKLFPQADKRRRARA